MNGGHGPRDNRPTSQVPAAKVQVLTFEHHTGRSLHSQLATMPPESRHCLNFLVAVVAGALNGVSRAVAPQAPDAR